MPLHYQFNYMCANNRCCCQNIIIETIKKNKKCSSLLMLSNLSFAVGVYCVSSFVTVLGWKLTATYRTFPIEFGKHVFIRAWPESCDWGKLVNIF